MSILTVTLNACVDKTYTVPGFALNRVHRPQEMLVTAGGKGVNVARVYQKLGGTATATGFIGGRNGQALLASLDQEGIPASFIDIQEESRVCIAIMDPINGTQTELNENGPNITSAHASALIQRLRELLPLCNTVIISGSVPPGTPISIYREIIEIAQREYGVKAILDSSGPVLAEGAKAAPFLLKPNMAEIAALGIKNGDWVNMVQLLRQKYQLQYAMITDGPRGAILASDKGVWQASPPQITVASAVGSGDSLTAAFVWALSQGYSDGEALQLGVAAGAANATCYGAGFLNRDEVFSLADKTVLNKVAVSAV